MWVRSEHETVAQALAAGYEENPWVDTGVLGRPRVPIVACIGRNRVVDRIGRTHSMNAEGPIPGGHPYERDSSIDGHLALVARWRCVHSRSSCRWTWR